LREVTVYKRKNIGEAQA